MTEEKPMKDIGDQDRSLSKMFASYHRLDKNSINSLWRDAHFVLDANVLLNLYRYSSKTKQEMILILTKLKKRIWIPHHAALEFERSRLRVIAEQKSMFGKVKGIVSSNIGNLVKSLSELQLEERHSKIDASKFLESLLQIKDGFITELDAMDEQQSDVYQDDLLYHELDRLFCGQIGAPYTSQEQIKEISEERTRRNKSKIPTGYKDNSKDKDEDNEFYFDQLQYFRVDGDMIIWLQLTEFAKSENVKSIIFITDDRKDDWWRIVQSSGDKTVGPRPELIEEISKLTGGKQFWMYRPDRFVAFARDYLKINVSDSTVDEIRDTTLIKNSRRSRFRENIMIENAVIAWISNTLGRIEALDYTANAKNKFDAVYIDSIDGARVALDITRLRDIKAVGAIQYILARTIEKLQNCIEDFDRAVLVIVVDDIEMIDKIIHRFRKNRISYRDRVQIYIGICERAEDESECIFRPLFHFDDTENP